MDSSGTIAQGPRRPARAGRVLRWLHTRAFAFTPEQFSVGEGLRGATVVTLAVGMAVCFQSQELAWAAFAAFWTCLADPGGAPRVRLRVMAGFASCGAVVAGAVSSLSALGTSPSAILLFVVVAACTFIGLRAGRPTAGTLAGVVAVVAAEHPIGLIDAPARSLVFLGGGAMALLVSLALWPAPARGAARRAIALVFQELRDMTAEFAHGCCDPRSRERLRSEHRRSVRETIERARGQLAGAGAAPSESAEVIELARALDSGDRIFAGLIALSHGCDHAAPLQRELLRDLDAALAEVRRLVLKAGKDRSCLYPMTERLRAWRSASDPLVANVAEAWTAALERLADALPADPALSSIAQQTSPSAPASGELAAQSLRRAAIVLLTYLIGHMLGLSYVHWATMAAVVVTQPDASLSWPRMIERILGSVAGGLAAAALAAVLVQPWEQVAIVFPLAAATLALRSVNYTLFVVFLTPLFVMATAVFSPGGGEAVAAARAADNVLGSILALLGCLLLWPKRPSQALRDRLAQAVDANLSYALALTESNSDAVDAARRRAGACSTAAEQALHRMLLSAGTSRGALAEAGALLGTLRRLAGIATAMQIAGSACASDLASTLAEVAAQCHACGVAADGLNDRRMVSTLERAGLQEQLNGRHSLMPPLGSA